MMQPEPIEKNVLEALRLVMEEDFDDLLDDYLAQCDELWREAQAHFESGDLEQLRRSAHTFKGSCMSIGAEALMQQMADLEAAADSRQRDAAGAVMASAEAEIQRVVVALQRWRSV